jgi:nucleotide-binding universal stress UspA family protein
MAGLDLIKTLNRPAAFDQGSGEMYEKILVPLDGSVRTEVVLRHVEELAQRFAARVILLRVVDRMAPIGAVEPAYADLRQQEMEQAAHDARAYLAPLQGQLREKGVDVHISVAYGRIVDAILQTAESMDVDLITVASHGRSGMPRVFDRSVAAGLLQRSRRPLLLVPSRDG